MCIRDRITAESIVNTGNEMFPEVLFSIFTADWNNGRHALAAGIYQAYQNFPKALDSSGEGITIHPVSYTHLDVYKRQRLSR